MFYFTDNFYLNVAVQYLIVKILKIHHRAPDEEEDHLNHFTAQQL